MALFDSMLIVGLTYTIVNFLVQTNDLMFKPFGHKYTVKFIGGKSVSDFNKHVIPDKTNKLTSFVDIIIGRWKKDVLIGDKLCF